LTKRPENVIKMMTGFCPSENCWLGTSIENQEWADARLPHLHAAKRYGLVARTFVSAEPLVGHVVLQGAVYNHLGGDGIDWVITGGESGPNARPCDPEWFRSLRDQCEVTDTPFHFKQWGEFDETQTRVGKKNAGRLLDGRTHDGVPTK
jgi:protein gp37